MTPVTPTQAATTRFVCRRSSIKNNKRASRLGLVVCVCVCVKDCVNKCIAHVQGMCTCK
jgi:hypothetical protein